MSFDVPASTETSQCIEVVLPESTSVVAFEHDLSVGSHHIVLYRTDLTAISPNGETPHDCYDSANPEMVHALGVLYGSQTPHATQVLPDGIGLPVHAGEIAVLQVHYLNATQAPLRATARVALTMSDRAGLTRAGVMAFYDPMIHVPAGASAKASMSCPIGNDITLLAVFSHLHSRGTGLDAFVDAPADGPSGSPFYTSSDWENPAPLTAPLSISSGSRIRFECKYDNHSGTVDYYQGFSAKDDEMCVFGAIYYPQMGDGYDYCVDPDRLGTGVASCKDALHCRRACADEAAPGRGGLSPCIQACYAGSCPSATRDLLAVGHCSLARCSTECATRPSAECDQCVDDKCAEEVNACNQSVCSP